MISDHAGAGEVGVAGQFCRGRALQVNTILNHVIVMAMVHGSGYGKLGEEALLR